MRSSEDPNAAQCSRSSRLAHPLAGGRRDLAPGAVADRLVPRLQVVQAGREQERQRRADQQVVELAVRVLLEPLPLVRVEHRALVRRVEHAAGARVDHDQPRAAEVAAVAPARALHLAVGAERELAQDRPAVLGLAQPRVELVLGQVLRRQVAHVLVEPVRREAADDALVPPALARACARPRSSTCSSRRARRGRRRSSPRAPSRAASGCAARTTTRGTAACTPRSSRPSPPAAPPGRAARGCTRARAGETSSA